MSRSARRVSPDWVHPRDRCGHYVPLRNGLQYAQDLREWDQNAAKWKEGLRRRDGSTEWVPIDAEDRGKSYDEFEERPDPSDYMPEWPPDKCTHWQMYESVTEGTPISPVCGSPEELANWLVDHDVNAFAGTTASYQEWLSLILHGPTCSGLITSEYVKPGFAL